MSLTELQDAVTRLPAEEFERFVLWLETLRRDQTDEEYDEYVRRKIDEGLQASREGRTVSMEEVRRRFGSPSV